MEGGRQSQRRPPWRSPSSTRARANGVRARTPRRGRALPPNPGSARGERGPGSPPRPGSTAPAPAARGGPTRRCPRRRARRNFNAPFPPSADHPRALAPRTEASSTSTEALLSLGTACQGWPAHRLTVLRALLVPQVPNSGATAARRLRPHPRIAAGELALRPDVPGLHVPLEVGHTGAPIRLITPTK